MSVYDLPERFLKYRRSEGRDQSNLKEICVREIWRLWSGGLDDRGLNDLQVAYVSSEID